MDEKRLIASLEEAIIHSEIVRPGLPLYVTPRIDPGPKARLLEAVRAEEELQVFNNRMHQFMYVGQRLRFEHLVDWLVTRGHEVGPVRAVEDLKRYLGEEQIPFDEVAALAGITVDEGEKVDLGRGILLMPFTDIPDSIEKGSFTLTENVLTPSAALVCKSLSQKYPARGQGPRRLGRVGRRKELEEACMVLTLAGPSAPVFIASWATPEPWVPSVPAFSMSGPASELGAARTTLLSRERYVYAREIHELYAPLGSGLKQALRIPIDRLNQAMRRLKPADAAIDLGISFEALFLSDREPDRGELGFTLRVRVGRYLGSCEEERRELARLVRSIYAMRSSAVHSGSVPAEIEGIKVNELLADGYQVMANGIEKIIREGKIPEWSSVVFA